MYSWSCPLSLYQGAQLAPCPGADRFDNYYSAFFVVVQFIGEKFFVFQKLGCFSALYFISWAIYISVDLFIKTLKFEQFG